MTPLQEDIDFLEHYGVRGMQWGKRKPGTGKASSNKREGPKSISSKSAGKTGSKKAPKKSRKEKKAAKKKLRAEQDAKFQKSVVDLVGKAKKNGNLVAVRIPGQGTTVMTPGELASNIVRQGGIPRNAQFKEVSLKKS